MSNCPRCNEVLDAHTPVGHKEGPRRGDFSVCIYCGTALVIDSTNPPTFHILTDEERNHIDKDTLARLEKIKEVRLKMLSEDALFRSRISK